MLRSSASLSVLLFLRLLSRHRSHRSTVSSSFVPPSVTRMTSESLAWRSWLTRPPNTRKIPGSSPGANITFFTCMFRSAVGSSLASTQFHKRRTGTASSQQWRGATTATKATRATSTLARDNTENVRTAMQTSTRAWKGIKEPCIRQSKPYN